MKTPEDASRMAAFAAEQLALGKMSASTGASISQTIRQFLHATEAAVTFGRLRELERQLAELQHRES